MALKQNGSSEHEVEKIFSEKLVGFDDSVDVIKCLQQIKNLL